MRHTVNNPYVSLQYCVLVTQHEASQTLFTPSQMGSASSNVMNTSTHICSGRHTEIHSAPSTLAQQFIPTEIYGADFDLSSTNYDGPGDYTLVPCPMAENKCQQCGKQERHTGSIIVAIHTASRGAKSACGLYFARGSKHNVGRMAPEPVSDQKAHLWACFTALGLMAFLAVSELRDLRQVVVKTDSEYLVKSMTEYIVKWKENGFKNGRGRALADAHFYQLLDGVIVSLADSGVQVLFWLVPREQNKEAEELTRKTLAEANSSN